MQLGKTHYSEPFFLGSNRAHIELIVPIHGDDQHIAGTLVVLYPLETLLANQVPWWFTEKYKVEIIDDNDQLYASKTRIEGNGDQRYVIPSTRPVPACCCASPATARPTIRYSVRSSLPSSCSLPACSGACGWSAT
jgi:hypothetical protein